MLISEATSSHHPTFAESTSPRAPGSYPGAFLREEVHDQRRAWLQTDATHGVVPPPVGRPHVAEHNG
jgi:hypothetical protein